MASNPFLPKDAPVMAMDSAYELKGCYDFEHVKHPSVARLTDKEAPVAKTRILVGQFRRRMFWKVNARA